MDRSAFDRVVCLHNRKGGVYKTSLVMNIASIAGAAGHRVLAVDMDSQDNLSHRFGVDSDGGVALATAMEEQTALDRVIKARENVDVASGGMELNVFQPPVNPLDLLVEPLRHLADDYDLILIDVPPGDRILTPACLGVGRYLLAPVMPDQGSVQGLATLAAEIGQVRAANPYLTFLGAVLVGTAVNSTRIRANARTELAEVIGDPDALLTSSIRTSQASALECERKHLSAVELADFGRISPTEFFDRLRAGEKVPQRLDAAGPRI